MTLTAEILLDYPMPSFVGIPLRLSITGITFDGVAILAYIRRRMHLCFLDQEDAETLVGDSVTAEQRKEAATGKDKLSSTMNGLIKEIHIESEIGRQENGKQGLKNVGKGGEVCAGAGFEEYSRRNSCFQASGLFWYEIIVLKGEHTSST